MTYTKLYPIRILMDYEHCDVGKLLTNSDIALRWANNPGER